MPAPKCLLAISTPLGEDVLLLRTAQVHEELGRPFSIDAELISDDEDILLDNLLGKNVTISLETDEETRYFNGIITEFFQKENIDRNACYGAVIKPWFWLLTLSENCRIFQEKSYPDIIKSVFDDLGFSDYEDQLTGTYTPQEYVVQYNESDFNFVSRIMEQEGIYYYFSHTDSKHALVMIDDNSVLPDNGEVPYNDIEDGGYDEDLEGIKKWENYRKLRTGGVSLTDFDFTTPSKKLDAVTADPKTGSISALQKFSYPGKYSERAKGTDYTRILMEKENVEYEEKACEGNFRTLFSGSQFTLVDHHRDDQNGSYLVTKFTCTLKSDAYISSSNEENTELYSCKFIAISSNVVYRPQITTTKPKMTGPQTAMVVGKSGEEIWTDKYGRVKVLFHWDRVGEGDEKSSCWIRVSQSWAGKSWGSIQIPRIGQEVLIDFLHGDPDQPIIIGSVYNGSSMPPFTLPANATMSGVKSRSSKGGGGFNEFSLEDKKGEEKIFIHGEKDQTIEIKNDCNETIGNDRQLTVKNDQIELIENNRTEEVKADHTEKIGKDRTLDIVGKEEKTVESTLSLTVTGDVTEVFKANYSMDVTDDIDVKGTNISIEATTEITLTVGGSSIKIDASGITIETSGMAEVKAGGITTVKGSMVNIN